MGPEINESFMDFNVNKQGKIRFGLGAIKGTGEAAVEAIIDERDENGSFANIFDFSSRVNLRAVNKKTFESLAMGGAFDCFTDIHRKQYFHQGDSNENTGIELAIKYGNGVQNEKNASQVSLFGGDSNVSIPLPRLPVCEPYSDIEKLNIEKDVVGFYISGHPLDQYKLEIDNFCTCHVDEIEKYQNQIIHVGGIVTKFNERYTKKGHPFGLFSIEDYNGSLDMAMFGEEYLKLKHMLVLGNFVFMTGRVEERYNQPGVWEFRPRKIQLLSEIKDELSKEFSLFVNAADVNENLVMKLTQVATDNPGKCKLTINIFDEAKSIEVALLSKKYMINPSNELIDTLNSIEHLNFKIVKDKVELPPSNKPDFKRFAKS